MNEIDHTNDQRVEVGQRNIRYKVLRGIANPTSDFEALIEKAFENVRTPSSKSGSLDLRRIPLTFRAMQKVLVNLSDPCGPVVKHMSVAYCELGDSAGAFDLFCHFLQSTENLESVDLSYNYLSQEALDRLVHSLRKSSANQIRLRSMNFEGHQGGKLLTKLLERSPPLDLDLTKNRRLGMDGALSFSNGLLVQKHNLTGLDLTGCCLGDRAAATIILSLVNTKITKLVLARNQLSLESLACLTKVLSSPKSSCLKILDLSYNSDIFGQIEVSTNGFLEEHRAQLTKEQIKASQDFAKAIQDHKTCQELRLSYCDMFGECAVPLFRALEKNKSVRLLDLLCTPLGRTGFNALFSSMSNMNIQELGVDWTYPRERSKQLIHSVMVRNQSICRVFDSLNTHNPILHRCLQKNRVFQRVEANVDRPPSFWVEVMASLAANNHEGPSENVGGTLLYQFLRQVLPPHADAFVEWVRIDNLAWDEE